MSDDSLMDLSDDAVSILANIQDLLERLTPIKREARAQRRKRATEWVWFETADRLLISAATAIEEAGTYLDRLVEAEVKRR